MKILGRIKKSKVLTAVMTAVLIFQSACPTGLAYAAEQARSSAVLTVTASVDDLDETLPTLKSPTDFTAGSAIGTCPAFWVANDDGTSYAEALMAKKQKQGLALNWYNEETGESFDWYKTKVTDSIHVVGKWEKYDVSVTFSANDGTTESDTETVPYGQSYKQAFGKEKAAPATRRGYEFAGWYDSTTNKPFDFTKKLTDPTVSVYAKWKLVDAVEVSPSDTARPAQTATGTCSINGTWFGSPFPWGSIARFNLSNFTGELAGATVNDAQCVDSGAENPYLAGRRSATYQATLTSFDETTGKAVYDVYLYPAGHVTGDMYVVRPPHYDNVNVQSGVQRMHTTITVYKVVKGYIEIQKASTCTNVSDNNKLYSLAGAEFSIYDASGKFVQKLATNEKGEHVMKPFWDMTEQDMHACLEATDWRRANYEYFRGGGFSSHFRCTAEMPVTMLRMNIVEGVGPVLQIAEGWTANLPDGIHTPIDQRTDPTWPTTWFVPRTTGEGAFRDVYSVMANWGANHGVTVYGHVGADLITLASMLRIPVALHNVPQEKVYRPHAWAAFGTKDTEAADFAACKHYGPLYR